MVFSTTTLFKGIACPKGDSCRLTHCIFSHNSKASRPPQSTASSTSNISRQPLPPAEEPSEPVAKRRKITYGSLADKPPSRADLIRSQLASVRSKSEKPVTPPPTTRATSTAVPPQPTKPSAGLAKTESLNPRLIPNDPAGHQKRSTYLKYLHAEMMRLNRVQKESEPVMESQQICTEQQLITMSLDLEEQIAQEQPALYGNVVKQKIAAFRKMPQPEWGNFVKSALAKDQPEPDSKKEEKMIETGLAATEEHLVLPQLVTDQKDLTAFGYVPTPPTEEAMNKAAAAVEASMNYEICDRCAARFQVFPERNEDGMLTSNGPCYYHPLRKVFPQRVKKDKGPDDREPYHPCCHEKVGNAGCTKNEEHVFKTNSPARLASILPFAETPDNPSPAKDRQGRKVHAVTFDCEMGFTAHGLELVRLTAVTWPQGEELIDILVRPLGAVIDLNSRFSGVFPETFHNAIAYDDWKSSPPQASSDVRQLPVVDTPQRARELLCSFLTRETPLIGHAIDNDLNTVRLCHPTIIDTILLYPHPRGLPMRLGLRTLTERHLNRAIQQGGDSGHDSREDAVATGDLVRLKVGEKWKFLRATGWKVVNGKLVPPESANGSPPKIDDPEKQEISAGKWHRDQMSSDELSGSNSISE